jgi:hypothetical protein
MKRVILTVTIIGAVALGCAHLRPVVTDVVTCSGKTISGDVANMVYRDIRDENWADIAENIVPILAEGWSDVQCIYNALTSAHPELVPHMERLKAGHVELRAVEGS